MHTTDWLQFAFYLGLLMVLTKPMGLYLMGVLDADGRTWLDPVVKPLETLTYRLLGVDPRREQGWKQYTFALLAFSLVGVVFTYAILRLQHLLPWNPQGLPALSHHLAFNTAVSFTTNTNWQSYGGEATMSYFSQMVGLTFHNFVSAATGIAIAAALARGISRSSVKTLGNFWLDLTRTTYYLGRMVKNQAHGWAVWAAMMVLFIGGVLVCAHFEAAGNPIHQQQLGVAAEDGNMEGKEVRFGIFNSALFATITTSASCGAVNAMHDSFTALGGLVPLFMIQLGEVVIGGVGAGLYGMLVFVILAVFIAGLMVGRTPEYLGKKIQAKEVKLAMLTLLVLTLSILGFTAWACVSEWGVAGLNNAGPHGFSEMLYAYSSATGNNGSAFAGLTANTPWYNSTLGFAMLIGRFLMIVPIMALAGSLAGKQASPPSAGTFPVNGATFTFLLIGTVLLIGALNFLPALALGPIVEHFLTAGGKLF